MPRALRFLRPGSLGEAIALLDEHGEDAKVLAGGTAVTILLRQRLIDPGVLVSIGRLPDAGLCDIVAEDGHLRIGGLVTHRDVERSALVRERIPVVAETFGKVANVRVRNVATVGGVMAEADYASDPPAVMLALDAEIEVTGPSGTRRIPAADFFLAFYSTALEPNELITAVRVPVPQPGTRAVYEKFVTRSSEDRPCVGVLAAVRFGPDGHTTQDVRVSVAAAAETPQRFPDLEAELVGSDLPDARVREVASAYADRIDTLDDMRGSAWYRKEMVRVWVRRTVERAAAEAREARTQA